MTVGATTRFLRLEGAALLVGATWGFALTDASWGLYALLLFVPDVSMAGYLRGPRVGAHVYNAAHTTLGPAALAAVASAAGWTLGVPVALVWAAHIGLDRMLGYGLKRPEGFHHTHLGPVGPAARG